MSIRNRIEDLGRIYEIVKAILAEIDLHDKAYGNLCRDLPESLNDYAEEMERHTEQIYELVIEVKKIASGEDELNEIIREKNDRR